MAQHAGIGADVLLDVLSRSSARSRALEMVGANGSIEQDVQRLQKYFMKDVAAAHASAALCRYGPGCGGIASLPGVSAERALNR